MLIIEVQPDPNVPHELGIDTEWKIRNDEYILQQGRPAVISFLISAGGPGVAGTEFTIGGVSFMTSDFSSLYTPTTFYYSPTLVDAAENLANMLRSNYRFVDWSISVNYTISAPSIIVTITAGQVGEQVGDDWVNDVSLLGFADAQFNEGANEIRANSRLWYRFWSANTPLGVERTADFDATGRVVINVKNLADRIIGITPPYLLWNFPFNDTIASRRVYLKFGSYTLDNCAPVYEEVYETMEVTLVNAIYQHTTLSGFRPFTPQVQLPVRWMTQRPNQRTICKASYEWTSVWITKTSLYNSGSWRVRWRYYAAGGSEIMPEQIRGIKGEGVFHVNTGTANQGHPSGVMNLAAYYTVQVEVRESPEGAWIPYSEMITITLGDCSCNAAEVYYLEDFGSWRTANFEKLESRRVDIPSVAYSRPVAHNNYGQSPNIIQIYQEGGRYSEAEQSDSVFTLSTPWLTRFNRLAWEEFMRSKYHFILTASDILSGATRRILIDERSVITETRGALVRVSVSFRYNIPHRIRK